VKILMTNNTLLQRGGSESYLETVSTELRRLGHEVVFYSPECGLVADRLRARGFEVHDDAATLPGDLDVVHGQHSNAVARLRETHPRLPLVFATHSWFVSVEDPVVELGAGAYVAFNELTRRRLAAHVAGRHAEVVRLTQPVDISFADGFRDPLPDVPRRAVAVSRRMTTIPTRLARACAERGIDFARLGGPDSESDDPRAEMRAADIVLGIGRTALEGMAAARAVLLVDETSVGGWVGTASYPALEADGFTGLGLGEVGRTLLDGYSPDLGVQARRLVVRHHAAQHHAAALVELYASVADSPATAVAPDTLGALLQDRFALEHRAVEAEWEVARLRVELRRTRIRARRFRRQRDRAREALAGAGPAGRWLSHLHPRRRGDAEQGRPTP
jgi:hypothetical protein